MKNLGPAIYQFLGVLTNGDLGPYTIYTDQRKEQVIFLKTWPKDPATYHQKIRRNRWSQIAFRWRVLDEDTKTLWKELTRKANLTITYYNLFYYYMLDKDIKVIETLQRNTGIDVITPTGPPLPPLST